ncbi:MAG: hypothetical protein C5B47_04270 [Verrucomicrobia bacterium]|nr:MAG: hypothetical protein C5B47_04270 [Verrucomicrobiota bacterium]
MNRYITAILFLVAIACGVSIFFLQPWLQKPRSEEVCENFLLSLDPEKIRSIQIHNGDDVIRIERRGSNWQVASKMQDRASPEIVAQILQAAKSLRVYDKISAGEFKKELDIGAFGLKWPRQSLSLAGDQKAEIWFGNDAAIRGRIYARKQNSKTVYVISDQLQTLISRPFNVFRDRQLTQWMPDQIRSFVIRRNGNELEVQQTGNRWRMTRPLEARVNTQKVYQFLDTLLTSPILEFVDDESGDLEKFGIDDQAVSITFDPDTGEPPAILRLGSPVADEQGGGYYAQFSARGSVIRLPSSVAQLLEINPGDLRERSLFQLHPDILDRIVIRSGGHALTLSRNEEGWIGRQGNQEFSVSNERIQQFLSLFEKQDIKKFLTAPENIAADYGLAPPHLSIEFYSVLSENTPEASAGPHQIGSVLFSAASQDGVVYAQSSDSPEILVVDPSILSLISIEPSNWKQSETPLK